MGLAGRKKPRRQAVDPVKPVDSGRRESAPVGAHIGKSVVIKGELSGSEDLYVDGEVEGSIELGGHNLTIGQNGRVRANVNARDVSVQGRVDGNIHAGERLELRKTSIVVGDVRAQRIAIEDGAFLKGKVDTEKEARPDGKHGTAAAAASGSGVSTSTPQPAMAEKA
jgi:cytoskeletal protein CcmA (bactofilin family)